MAHEIVKVLSDLRQLTLPHRLEQLVLVTLNLASILQLRVALGEFITHFHLRIQLTQFVAFLLVFVSLVGLLEQVLLQLKLVFKVLLLFDLAKIQVLFDHQVDVRRRLSLPDGHTSVPTVLLVEIGLIFVLRLDLAL